jgi:hypothetical protein
LPAKVYTLFALNQPGYGRVTKGAESLRQEREFNA